MIRVLIADDHKLFVDGLISLLAKEENINVVAKAHNGKEMLECLNLYDIDVVLSDINMPEMDGMEAAKIALRKHRKVKIVMLSMHKGSMIIREVIKIGVHGYILKNTDNAELVHAINTVYDGKSFFSNEVQKVLVDSAAMLDENKNVIITKREKSVIKLLCQGNTSSEIADILKLSVYTIDTHRKNLMLKTKSKNVIALVNYAYKNNLVDIKPNITNQGEKEFNKKKRKK